MGAFEYRQAEEIRDAFARHGERYLFIGNSAAIVLGFPDASQVAELFVEKSPDNGRAIVAALRGLGFALDDEQAAQIEAGKDFVQLKSGPFDLDLVFAPDGIERFADAWRRRVEVGGFSVCHLDDIIASKEATGRAKDRESLPRLRSFREYWQRRRPPLTLPGSRRCRCQSQAEDAAPPSEGRRRSRRGPALGRHRLDQGGGGAGRELRASPVHGGDLMRTHREGRGG
jgi:hypothetical protein